MKRYNNTQSPQQVKKVSERKARCCKDGDDFYLLGDAVSTAVDGLQVDTTAGAVIDGLRLGTTVGAVVIELEL